MEIDFSKVVGTMVQLTQFHRLLHCSCSCLIVLMCPSVWNSLSYNYRSAELLSTFERSLKIELFDVAYRKGRV